ncbi:hypothetical protein ACWCYY_10910 [Kitasatospora sp. NPDC001664]
MDHTTHHAPAGPVYLTADGYQLVPAGQSVYLPGPAPRLVPVHRPHVIHPAAVHQPVPYPAESGRDPWPARLLCGGVGIGAAGAGLGFLLQAVAAATTGLGLIAASLALLWLIKNQHGGGSSGRGAVNVHVNVSNRNR